MKTFQLNGTARTDLGKKAVKGLRKQGLIPAVLNGGELVELPYQGALKPCEKLVELPGGKKGIIVTDFTVTKDAVRKLVYTPDIFAVELTIDGEKKMAVLKDLQFHPVTDAILHMDFLEVSDKKPVVMEVPVQLEGHSEGVRAGGKLSLSMRKLKVKAIYSNIPERLVINIDNLGLGKTLQVGELHFEGLVLMKYLIVGLGNIGYEYENTRHNIGFRVLDALAKASNLVFTDGRYGATCELRLKGRVLVLLKPSTYMNLSGNAVRYWLQKENIPVENMLVVVDDLALPFGTLRLKPKGSDAGHNGLKHICEILGTQCYARLRFGIGNDFPRGGQVEFVLGSFPPEEEKQLPEKLERAGEIIKSFCLAGVQQTMNQYNNK